MRVELRKLSSITPYGNNPRVNQHAVEAVAKSIQQFGFRVPIVVDRDGVVITGHTRLKAAATLGLKRVPVHVARDLTPARAKAYRIADNRLGELANWDIEKLTTEIDHLKALGDFDLEVLGWDAEELADLLTADAPEPADETVPPAPKRPTSQLGDLWQLGPHRLMCGDSTDLKAVERLMGTRVASMVLTDPPYGIEYVGKGKAALRIKNDDHAGLENLLRCSLTAAAEYSKPGATWCVAGPAGPQSLAFGKVLTELQVWRQTLVWVKDSMVLGRSDFHYRHEVIFYGWTPGRHRGPRDRTRTTVLEFDRPKVSTDHPTMKPIALWLHLLDAGSRKGDVVYEPFDGSGTTLAACEQAGRVCCAMELDPRYVDVAVLRWQALTGKQATLEGSGKRWGEVVRARSMKTKASRSAA